MAFCYYAEVKCDDNGELFVERVINPELAPVVHAHWVTDDYGYAILNEKGHTLYLAGVPCSHCHMTGQTNWNYCPNCGAIMDKEVKDDNTCL